MISVYDDTLERESRTIRILTLLPGSWATRIQCQLRQVYLDDNPVYEAVSYAWGDPEDVGTLSVEGVEMQVPSNLEICLRYLRQPSEPLQLWVDCICINQKNLREKESQIGMMGEIFRRCSLVYVWLGIPATFEVSEKTGCETVENINPFTIVYHFAEDRHFSEFSCYRRDSIDNSWQFHDDDTFKRIWDSFKDVLQRPWWSRLWCVQECLLPPSVLVALGHWRISWETLKRSQANHEHHMRSCCAEVAGLLPLDFIFSPDMTVFHTRLGSNDTPDIRPDTSLDLDLLLRSFQYKACKDPRDKVYGILGLIDQSRYSKLSIDYSLNTEAVYTNVMSAILRHGRGSLRCLTGIGFASTEYRLPSWVRNFGARPALEVVKREQRRHQAYTLYSASASEKYQSVVLDGNTLRLRGVVMDKVLRVGKVIEHRSWKHLLDVILDWSAMTGVDIPEDMSREYFYRSKANDFWRTIVGDSRFQGDRIQRRTNQADLEGLRLWLPKMLMALKTGVEPPVGDGWLSTMISFTYGRGMLVTERGHIGLCYSNCQIGDELWGLHGGNVPSILRRRCQLHEGEVQDNNQYIFVGEGYLQGYMDGRILEDGFSRTKEVVLS